jgi:hypothetical protein
MDLLIIKTPVVGHTCLVMHLSLMGDYLAGMMLYPTPIGVITLLYAGLGHCSTDSLTQSEGMLNLYCVENSMGTLMSFSSTLILELGFGSLVRTVSIIMWRPKTS